jgi:hypothetical protein
MSEYRRASRDVNDRQGKYLAEMIDWLLFSRATMACNEITFSTAIYYRDRI